METKNLLTTFPEPNSGELLLPEFLSRMHLVAPTDPAVRQGYLASVFGATAALYDQLIDMTRNLENIRNLVTCLTSRLGRSCELLDIGCGPGLTHRVVSDCPGIRITALDACPTMLQMASAEGMQTITPNQIRQADKLAFDGAFAAYVMDVEPCLETMSEAFDALRPGGIFVANFHKGRGLSRFIDWANAEGYRIEEIPMAAQQAKHGPVWALEKNID